MKKYNYQKFVNDNLNERGNFTDDGVLKKIGASSLSFGEDATYTVSIGFYHDVREPNEKSGRMRTRSYSYRIVAGQDGLSIKWGHCKGFDVLEVATSAAEKMAYLLDEFKKYEFEAYAYELWSDHPDVKYYVSEDDAKRNSWSNVFVL